MHVDFVKMVGRHALWADQRSTRISLLRWARIASDIRADDYTRSGIFCCIQYAGGVEVGVWDNIGAWNNPCWTYVILSGINHWLLFIIFFVSILSNDFKTRTTQFDKTPPMPTYLNAFVVSDFSSLHNTNATSEFTQHLFARPNAIDRGAFGLETGQRILNEFEQRLQVNYTLPKMDQIAVPRFGGAMENWGLIIYGYGLLDIFVSNNNIFMELPVVRNIYFIRRLRTHI